MIALDSFVSQGSVDILFPSFSCTTSGVLALIRQGRSPQILAPNVMYFLKYVSMEGGGGREDKTFSNHSLRQLTLEVLTSRHCQTMNI